MKGRMIQKKGGGHKRGAKTSHGPLQTIPKTSGTTFIGRPIGWGTQSRCHQFTPAFVFAAYTPSFKILCVQVPGPTGAAVGSAEFASTWSHNSTSSDFSRCGAERQPLWCVQMLFCKSRIKKYLKYLKLRASPAQRVTKAYVLTVLPVSFAATAIFI